MRAEMADTGTPQDLMTSSAREALRVRVTRQRVARGEIFLPAVPAMVDDYVAMCNDTFKALGVHFSAEELGELRKNLESELVKAFAESSRSEIVIRYEVPVGHAASYHVAGHWHTVAQAYESQRML